MDLVKFFDMEENSIHYGILVQGEYIVCGCCGGVIELEDEEVEILDKRSTSIEEDLRRYFE